MSKMSLLERYLLNLGGRVPEGALHFVNREYARQRLREITGQDFGYDQELWRKWLDNHPEIQKQHQL
jgi:hypothetical protein